MLDQQGADGLVLFNRFYQPDIELETLEVMHRRPAEHANGDAPADALDRDARMDESARASQPPAESIAATDALKMFMAGADVTMLCSVLIAPRDRTHPGARTRDARMDGGTRIRIGRATQRQHEPK